MSLILLEKIKNHESTTKIFLEKWLCQKILSSNQDPKVYLDEVISSGGKTGGIGELIYYKDIYPFFEKNYEEIQFLTIAFIKNGGRLQIKEDLKSEITWLAIQIVAFQIACSIGLKT